VSFRSVPRVECVSDTVGGPFTSFALGVAQPDATQNACLARNSVVRPVAVRLGRNSPVAAIVSPVQGVDHPAITTICESGTPVSVGRGGRLPRL
jgi:hypothetical protein